MNSPALLHPSWPFPAYRYLPGDQIHPKYPDGHMAGQVEPETGPIDLSRPEKSEFLRFALDLYNHEYFWESHIYLEALWNAHARTGVTADFLRSLIAIAAAGVKIKMHQPVQALHHLSRAYEGLQSVKKVSGSKFLGFDLDQIVKQIQIAIRSGECTFLIQPTWN